MFSLIGHKPAEQLQRGECISIPGALDEMTLVLGSESQGAKVIIRMLGAGSLIMDKDRRVAVFSTGGRYG
ncbi:hypothetical protein [Vibrio spartinae]|uniref:Uncharacterized protein n=1 Tax=Vibrio spartinae TaxID=1918945 RepID=A0A1N6M5H6_9VIBR|nr:hypothetical protein [Vibrio spartinae]SIO94682.1 hypothetical protein VSP9026_02411 [Vibrio spartinae]